ncbi:MAG TPA: MarR family winged helix-turn-helix transcriptional regulator [Solirubrobacteraceae bacterium]|nr:MarR family winged helix-turn-helix transcriptional regulator [Solirubrobacteraceae bacterium]
MNIENCPDGPVANSAQDAPTAFVSSAPIAPPDGQRRGGLAPAPLEGPVSPDSTAPFHSVGFTISTAGYAIARRFKAVLAPLDLEPREFALLRAVAASEGQSQHALGARLQIPPSRMVAFVDALEQRGLLERRQNPSDRRSHALYLTDAGHELLSRAFALAVEHERDLCAGLSAQEREQLLELLQRVGMRLGLPPGVHSALADE